ncbi:MULTISPECIES: hypothetical protein [Brevundimonas]|uniref:hypothetical protein n=1 Tax=Brevundimonas TaxID=41275 RepID=UPI0028A1F8F5|nr:MULTISPECIES: hypothetical protein [Brevundimonas]
MGAHPTGDLADALISCGIKPVDVKVEWDADCQEDVLTFSAAKIPNGVLIDLADLYLSFPTRFVFASEDLETAFQGILSKSPRLVALRDQALDQQHEWLKTRGLSAFRKFDPAKESVGDFAVRVEIACNAERGDLLSVKGNDAVSIHPRDPSKLTLDRMRTLLALLETCAPNLLYFVTGEDGPG